MIDRRILGRDGNERVLSSATIARFGEDFGGNLIWAGDPNYAPVRQVWNGMVDKHPAVVAQCKRSSDALACMRFARQHELLVSVRGGGHNYAGNSVCDGGLVIDFSPMRAVAVDPDRRTARAEAGVRLGEFDQCTQAYGLATTLGVNTDTGIAGLTLGGGYGWLAGKFGIACDNLAAVELITVDGQLLKTSAEDNSDLFWGVRGAGANLGIVTSFEYRIHDVGPVMGGMVLYPISQGRSALRLLDEYSATCPDDVSTCGLLLITPDGQPAVGIAVCYAGPLEFGEKILAPLTRSIPVLGNTIETQPYVKQQTMFDLAWPPRRLYYHKPGIVRRLSEAAIDILLEFGQTLPTNLSAIALQQLHGAAARVSPSATAFPHRFPHFSLVIHPATDDRAEAETIVSWGQRCWSALRPEMERAVYVNALETCLDEDRQRVMEAYGHNYARVAQLKQRYDPANFLSCNQNVQPR